MRFQVKSEGGPSRTVTVTDVGSATVTIDANHPLAGKPLNFEVKVVDARRATEEEVQAGKVAKAG